VTRKLDYFSDMDIWFQNHVMVLKRKKEIIFTIYNKYTRVVFAKLHK
jgi:hypothetical protein